MIPPWMRQGTSGLLDAVNAARTTTWADLTLAQPLWLWLCIPTLLVFTWRVRADRQRAHWPVGAGAVVSSLPVGRLVWWMRIMAVLSLLAAGLMIVAMAKPEVIGKPDPSTSEGIDIIVALDISTSMRAADFRPKDRLTVAKQVITEHVLSREADRVGLIVFAGEAFTQVPLTHDRQLLRDVLNGIQMGIIVDGTAIGDGLSLSVARLQRSQAKTKTVILVTDGDNNAGSLAPESAIKLAQDVDVRVYPILVGKGGKVPYPDGVDVFGNPHYSQVDMPVNPDLLKRIAKDTKGAFFQATDARSLSTSLQQILAELDRSVLDGGPPARRHIDISVLPLLTAAVLLFVVIMWRAKRGRVLSSDDG
jgi:Ca-activated chloride channel homolog